MLIVICFWLWWLLCPRVGPGRPTVILKIRHGEVGPKLPRSIAIFLFTTSRH